MENGYYWAKEKGKDTWEIVEVTFNWIHVIADDCPYPEDEFEFAEKIEDKNNK